jgi:hypothetical protein
MTDYQKWIDKKMNGIFFDDNGNAMTDAEARIALQERLDAGDKYIPSGNCDNFDPQKGCLGHG